MNLKLRGLEQVLFGVMDGLPGLNNSFTKGRYLSVVKEALIIMFDHSSLEIRKEAIDIFRKINSENQKRYSNVLMPVIKSKIVELDKVERKI